MKALSLSLLLALVLASTPACLQPPPNLTPQATVAFTADQGVQRLQELENAAIDWASQDQRNVAGARLLVQFCVTSAQALGQAPLGWQATLTTAWHTLQQQPDYPKAPGKALATLLATFDAAVTALGAP